MSNINDLPANKAELVRIIEDEIAKLVQQRIIPLENQVKALEEKIGSLQGQILHAR